MQGGNAYTFWRKSKWYKLRTESDRRIEHKIVYHCNHCINFHHQLHAQTEAPKRTEHLRIRTDTNCNRDRASYSLRLLPADTLPHPLPTNTSSQRRSATMPTDPCAPFLWSRLPRKQIAHSFPVKTQSLSPPPSIPHSVPPLPIPALRGHSRVQQSPQPPPVTLKGLSSDAMGSRLGSSFGLSPSTSCMICSHDASGFVELVSNLNSFSNCR